MKRAASFPHPSEAFQIRARPADHLCTCVTCWSVMVTASLHTMARSKGVVMREGSSFHNQGGSSLARTGLPVHSATVSDLGPDPGMKGRGEGRVEDRENYPLLGRDVFMFERPNRLGEVSDESSARRVEVLKLVSCHSVGLRDGGLKTGVLSQCRTQKQY
ncbi:hypothetical protein RRG08_055317 [Elysia crispata]|uniref:Uncharacterized protein n=1 Tax=Elysia crispata TaxID=231223 RepID=A0AAE1AQ92_9GAST|nr:hypothetical protein RRG08_055317 [Elysia crispata]